MQGVYVDIVWGTGCLSILRARISEGASGCSPGMVDHKARSVSSWFFFIASW